MKGTHIKMDGGRKPAVVCNCCGDVFTLHEDETDGNVPRMLFCGHTFCTSCLQSLECSSAIRCPDCQVESMLPDAGVCGLEVDKRTIGLVYTAKINKMKSNRSMRRRRSSSPLFRDGRTSAANMDQCCIEPSDAKKIEKGLDKGLDKALAKAAENLAQLERLDKTLTTGLAEQVKRETARLEMEFQLVAEKAVVAVHKWKAIQRNRLTNVESRFSATYAEVCRIQERMKDLETAMKIAREVNRVPFLEQYCTLDKVLETLQAPVGDQSFDMKCITTGSGMSYVFQSNCQDQSLELSLKMEIRSPKQLTELPPKGRDLGSVSPCHHAEGRKSPSTPRGRSKLPSPGEEEEEISRSASPSPRASPILKPHPRLSPSTQSLASDPGSPDVIIEDVIDTEEEHDLPPTGPELANDKWRAHRKGKRQFFNRRKVTQWVAVTHIVNPSHFYVQYLAERREGNILSQKVNDVCSRDRCRFSAGDTVITGSMIFAKWEERLWCRATVKEIFQTGCAEPVRACPVTQLNSVHVFLLDCGLTKTVTIQSEANESTVSSVNNHLRKVDEAAIVLLDRFVPQAVRCSLKDLVPYHLTKGWSKEAEVEFRNMVGSTAVKMCPMGQDRDSLLVDLKKVPKHQPSDSLMSIREYLVFIEVARFYSPLTLARKPLLYYPPVLPKSYTQYNAVVSCINTPSDFHIQLVDNMESLLLSAKIQECYNATTVAGRDNLVVYCPVIGNAYVARYEAIWCRVQVIGHPQGGQVEVQYVDSGNKKTIPVSDLRKIKDEFFLLPCMAIRCCLSNVIPLDGKTWSEACINKFIDLAQQKLVTIVSTAKSGSPNPLPVKIFESSLTGKQTNIAKLLVAEQLACFKDRLESKDDKPPFDNSPIWDPLLELSASAEGLDGQNGKGEQGEQPSEFQPQLKCPENLKDVKVKVTHVNSPSSFFIQFTQNDSLLKRVCELLKQEYAHKDPEEVLWKADMHCAAHISGVWERGLISSDVTSNSNVEVMRCDYGNKVKLHTRDLRPLPSSLTGSFALECTLTDIRPAGGRSTWTATACDFISCHLTGASAVLTMKEMTDERPVPVTLHCNTSMGELVGISDVLVNEGLALRERKPRSEEPIIQKPKDIDAESPTSKAPALRSDDSIVNTPPSHPLGTLPSSPLLVPTPTRPKPAPRTIMSAEKVKTKLYLPPELPCPGHIQMTISAVGEDGLIYARTLNAECHLEQLKEKIQQSMKALPKQKLYTWKSVLGCAINGSDMLWYRGQVLEVLGGHVRVQYVDYGLVENIPVVHAYPMLLCEDVPQLCIPCQLHGAIPIGGNWQQDAIALLKETLLNRLVDLKVMELPTDPREAVTVELFLDGLSVSRIMCHHKHAFVDRTVAAQTGLSVPFLDNWDIDTEGLRGPEKPMLGPFIYPNLPDDGEPFPVRVKHLLTPNELFLWHLKETSGEVSDEETLDEALTRVNANTEALPQLGSYCQGGPCLVEYRDGKYYRARLIKFVTMQPITIMVQHVDFGSDDTVPPSKLREMPVELLEFPLQVLKVRVAGFKAPRINTEELMLPYSPEWSVKAAMDMLDLLHGNITARLVAQEPEVTVQLYKDGELVHLPLVSAGLAELE